MSLELIRESIKVNQVIGEETTQTIVENDIIVPDVKPDISRILILDGDVFINSTEAMQDKIVSNGVIRYKILYAPDGAEKPVKSITTNYSFNCGINILNVRQGMKCRSKCEIEHIEYEILNGRKVNAKAILKVSGKVFNEFEKNFPYDMEGAENIQLLRKSYNINSYLGSNETNTTVRESMDIPAGKPAIREILRNDVKINSKDYKITDNKVLAKGELNISTLYIGDDEAQGIQFMEHEIPFNGFIDMSGINEDSLCEVDYRILDYTFEPEEDNDGELMILHGEVTLVLSAHAYNKRSVEVIEDAYSTKARVNIEKEPFRIDDIAFESTSQITIKDNIAIEEENPEIAEVFNVLSNPVLSEYKMVDDRILIDGIVNNRVLYLANSSDKPVFCGEKELPFKHVVEIKGVKPYDECTVDLDIEHCNYSMISSKEVEVRLVVNADVQVTNGVEIPLVRSASQELPDDKRSVSQPSIIVYFSQPDDTLWKIAKKYFTTISDIQKINDITDQEIAAGRRQIIIPRKTI